MRTMRIVELGRPLEMAEVPEPVPGPGEVLLRVRACGLNFADTLMAAGRYQEKPALPFAPGLEVCGTVERARPRRRRAGAGTRVAGLCGAGGLAEFVALPAAACAPVPGRDGRRGGRRLPRRLRHQPRRARLLARLRPGETLLVTGASGGVGLTAVEIGALLGARVVAVARGAEKRAVAAAAGAAPPARPRGRHRAPRSGRSAAPTSSTTPSAAPLFDACLRAARPGRAAAADRLRRRRRAADPGQPPAGEEPDGDRLLLRRLGRARTRRRRAPASRRCSPGTGSAACTRTSATCCRSRRRTTGSTCCGPAGPPARSWCGSPELLGGDPLGAAVGLAHAARQPLGQRRPRPVADVHVDQVVGQLRQRPAVADQLAARRDRARRAARRSRGRR